MTKSVPTWPLGIDEHTIPPREELLIQSANLWGKPFCGQKLCVWESVSGGTSIVHLMVGDKPHSVSAKGTPMKSYFFDKGQLGNGINVYFLATDKFGLLIRNDTDQPVKVGAALFGSPGE